MTSELDGRPAGPGPVTAEPTVLLALRARSGWTPRPRRGTVLADTLYLTLPREAGEVARCLDELAGDVDGFAARPGGDAVADVLREALAGRDLALAAFQQPAPEAGTSVGGVNLGLVPDRQPARLRCAGWTSGRAGADFAAAVALWQLLCAPLLATRFADELGLNTEPRVTFSPAAHYGTVRVELVVDGALVADTECLIRETLAALGRPDSVAAYRSRYQVPTLAGVDEDTARDFARLDEQLFPAGAQSIWTVLLAGPAAVSDQQLAAEARRMLATYAVHAGVHD